MMSSDLHRWSRRIAETIDDIMTVQRVRRRRVDLIQNQIIAALRQGYRTKRNEDNHCALFGVVIKTESGDFRR